MVFCMDHFSHAGQRTEVQWYCQMKVTKPGTIPRERERQQSVGLCGDERDITQKGILN